MKYMDVIAIFETAANGGVLIYTYIVNHRVNILFWETVVNSSSKTLPSRIQKHKHICYRICMWQVYGWYGCSIICLSIIPINF